MKRKSRVALSGHEAAALSWLVRFLSMKTKKAEKRRAALIKTLRRPVRRLARQIIADRNRKEKK